jgi:protein SCO1
MQRILMAAAAAVAIAIVAISLPRSGETNSRPWSENYVPNLLVQTQDGKTVRFYDDLIKGKIVIISFIYTSCQDICPLTTARLAQVEDKLGDAAGRDIFLISLSVDPEHDTPARLKEFSEAFSAGPGWTFVTGKPEDMRAILYKFGDRSTKLSEHRNEIVLGNDVTGLWQRDSAFGDLNRLVIAIRSMDPDWSGQAHAVPVPNAGNADLLLSSQPGQVLFKKMCAPCHTIGVGDKVGPDLRDVVTRRDPAWLARFIRNPAQLRAQRDPVALALAERFPAVRMPALGLAEADAADLIAYVQAETSRLTALQEPATPEQNHDHGHHHHH